MNLKILTWLWHQNPPRPGYDAEKINAWAAAMRRNLTIPHSLACVTNHPEGIDPSIEIIPDAEEFVGIRNPRWQESNQAPQCYRRLAMWAPDAAERFGAEWLCCMDFDVLILGNMDSVFTEEHEVRLLSGTSSRRPYNGGFVLLKAGARSEVYTEFTPERAIDASARYVGSDQAWISVQLGWGEAIFGARDGMYAYGPRLINENGGIRFQPPDDCRALFFPGFIKPWSPQASQQKWVQHAWERTRAGEAIPRMPRRLLARSKTALWTFDDPKQWGRLFYRAAQRIAGLRCRLFTIPESVPDGAAAFVRLDQQGPQRARSLDIHRSLTARGCVTLPTSAEAELYDNKIAQIPVIGARLPETIVLKSPDAGAAQDAIDRLGLPFVSKSSEGAGSANVRLIYTEAEALGELRTAFGSGLPMSYDRLQRGYVYWQRFIPGNDCDYRVCVVGDFVYGLIRQNRPSVPFASGSGKAEAMRMKTERERVAALACVKLAQEMDTMWMAFDVVFDGDEPKVIELSSAWTMKAYDNCPLFTLELEPTKRRGAESFDIAVWALRQLRERADAAPSQ